MSIFRLLSKKKLPIDPEISEAAKRKAEQDLEDARKLRDHALKIAKTLDQQRDVNHLADRWYESVRGN